MIMKVTPSKNILNQSAKIELIRHYKTIGKFTTLIEKTTCTESLAALCGNDFTQTYSFHWNRTLAAGKECR
ncbi:MAG: hypothetical protein KA247_03780, partial [Bacteroidetes bacterium]|nr:hypothetical protein [Bacteroidota bacterium]